VRIQIFTAGMLSSGIVLAGGGAGLAVLERGVAAKSAAQARVARSARRMGILFYFSVDCRGGVAGWRVGVFGSRETQDDTLL